MWIDVIPYRVCEDSLAVRTAASNHLRPGQILSLEDAEGQRLYGKITQIDQAPLSPADVPSEIRMLQQVSVTVIHGKPSFTMRQARVLGFTDLADELSKLQGQLDYPLKLGEGFQANVLKIGTLSIIDGQGLDAKLNVLHYLMEGLKPYQQIIVIDPLGVLNHPQANTVRAGMDVRLSLRDIGLKRFLTALSEVLPERAMDEAEPILAHEISANQSFFAFKALYDAEDLKDAFFKSTLQGCFSEIERQRVFAEEPQDILSLHNLIQDGITILDLSALSEPWKTLFYESAIQEALSNADADLVPVMIFPENYLSDLANYIKKANEAELAVIMLASPYVPESIEVLANNRFSHLGEGAVKIEGDLTYQLPVILNLPDFYETSHYVPGWQQTPSSYPTYTPPPDTGVYRPPVQTSKPVVLDEPAAPPPPEAASGPPIAMEPPKAAAPPVAGKPLDTDESFGFDSILGNEAFSTDPLAPPSASLQTPEYAEAPDYIDDEFDFSSDLMEIEAEQQHNTSPSPAPTTTAPSPAGPPTVQPTQTQKPIEPPPVETEAHVPILRTEHRQAEPVSPGSFKIGDKVHHEKYGVGVVNKIIPMDNNTVLNISFEQGGKRLMDPKLAHLERVS